LYFHDRRTSDTKLVSVNENQKSFGEIPRFLSFLKNLPGKGTAARVWGYVVKDSIPERTDGSGDIYHFA
jgi:hypothetical protein